MTLKDFLWKPHPRITLIVFIIFVLILGRFVLAGFVGTPFFLIGGCFFVLFVVLQIISIKRIFKAPYDRSDIDHSVVDHQIIHYPNEQIFGAIFGILRVHGSGKYSLKPSAIAILGVGKNFYPENTLIATDKRLLLIQIPLPGGNLLIGETDYVSLNFLFNRRLLRQKGEKLLQENSLPDILCFAINDVSYSDIKIAVLEKWRLVIEKTNGDNFGYLFWNKAYNQDLKSLLGPILKDRLVIK